MRASETEIDTLRVILAVKERSSARTAESCRAQLSFPGRGTDCIHSRAQDAFGGCPAGKGSSGGGVGGWPATAVGEEQLELCGRRTELARVRSGGGGSSSHTTGEAQGLPERTHETGGVGETMNLKHGTAAGPRTGAKLTSQSLTNAQNNEQRPGKWKKNKKAACRYTPEVLVSRWQCSKNRAGELRRIWGNSVLVRPGLGAQG
ncbi:hypothetical protein MRX96_052649 [Rhipicephalus microplus]